MLRLVFVLASLSFVVSGCATDRVARVDAGPIAPADAGSATDAAPADDTSGCPHWARPTGACTGPDVCCVSSTCVMGICR